MRRNSIPVDRLEGCTVRRNFVPLDHLEGCPVLGSIGGVCYSGIDRRGALRRRNSILVDLLEGYAALGSIEGMYYEEELCPRGLPEGVRCDEGCTMWSWG